MKVAIFGINNKNTVNKYKRFAKSIVAAVGNKQLIKNADVLNIVFVNDKYIKKLNKQFLKKDRPTDVLAFPMKINSDKTPSLIDDNVFGEIYISKDRAKKQAKALKIKVSDEIYNLIKHGILHLLGYSHQEMRLIKE
ncbi:MAG: rRNA maturation RNase YbeY [candidate division WOR-3 bacterium]